jgi:hypothetical protein
MSLFRILNHSVDIIRKDPIILAPGLFLSFIVNIGLQYLFPTMPSPEMGNLKTVMPAFFMTLGLEIFFLSFTLLMGIQLMKSDRIDFSIVKSAYLPTLFRLGGLALILTLPFVLAFDWWLYPQTLLLSKESPVLDSGILLIVLLAFFTLFSVAAVLSDIGLVLIGGRGATVIQALKGAWNLFTMHTRSSLLIVCYSIFTKWMLIMLAIGLTGIPVIGKSVLSVGIQGIEHTLTAMILLHFLTIGVEEEKGVIV